MAARDLPSRPNLEQYKKQAKDLLKQWKAHDPEALFRVAEHASRPAVKPSLADAQFVIAREHGFNTWSNFARQ